METDGASAVCESQFFLWVPSDFMSPIKKIWVPTYFRSPIWRSWVPSNFMSPITNLSNLVKFHIAKQFKVDIANAFLQEYVRKCFYLNGIYGTCTDTNKWGVDHDLCRNPRLCVFLECPFHAWSSQGCLKDVLPSKSRLWELARLTNVCCRKMSPFWLRIKSRDWYAIVIMSKWPC